MNNRRVFIVGGAGFLGYHTSLELVNRGFRVTVLALPDESIDDSLANKVKVTRADIDRLDDDELSDILSEQDVLIYAAGPDDRVELSTGVRATNFFQTQLVDRTTRVLRLAKAGGIKRAIIFGSYFSYINNYGLRSVKVGSLERHPYIKARVDQTRQSFDLGSDSFSVSVINIPYVFGIAPGKEPIWRRVFIDRFGKSSAIIYGSGGSSVISAQKIAAAAAQSIDLAEHGDELAVGSINMKFKPMIEELLDSANISKPVKNIPTWLMSLFMRMEWKKSQRKNIDSGLDLRYLAKDILSKDFYIDYRATDKKLQLGDYEDDVHQAIEETGRLISHL